MSDRARLAEPTWCSTAPELRECAVTGRLVIFAPERAARPLPRPAVAPPEPHPCPLCPGHEHATPPERYSLREADGWRLRVVPNKFPAVRPLHPDERVSPEGIAATGGHELIIETARHIDPAALTVEDWQRVVRCYRDRVRGWVSEPSIRQILVFRNVGAAAGASLEHPHSQLVALAVVPPEVAAEWHRAEQFHTTTGRCLFCDLLTAPARQVHQTTDCGVVCPVAPRFAYETWLVPRTHASHFEDCPDAALEAIAATLCALIGRLRAVLPGVAFNLTLHTGPPRQPAAGYHWHFRLMPHTAKPAGFEWGTGAFLNAVLPEQAAHRLRWL